MQERSTTKREREVKQGVARNQLLYRHVGDKDIDVCMTKYRHIRTHVTLFIYNNAQQTHDMDVAKK
jgi:hypothetical protein